jgi:hypothetical protein
MSTTTIAQPRPLAVRIAYWLGAAGLLLVLLLAAVAAFMMWRMNYVPDDLNLATTRLSNAGLYQVSYTTSDGRLPINQIHTWTLHVETPDGRPVENATILVDGDMPQHGHGLPTRPQVTRYLGNGDYLVEGMKFQMGGWWVIEYDIQHNGQTDHVAFNLLLQR